MNKTQVDLLGEYMNFRGAPILINDIPESVIERGAESGRFYISNIRTKF